MYPTARTKLAANAAHAAACMQEYAAVCSDRKQIRISHTHPWHNYRAQVNDDSLGVGFCRALGVKILFLTSQLANHSGIAFAEHVRET